MRSHRWNLRKTASFFLFAMLLLIAPRVSHAFDNYADDEAKLGGLAHTIQGLESEIHELLAQKQKVDDAMAVKLIMDQLASKHVELEKAAHEHEELYLHIRFRHPEQNAKEERKYTRYHVKSLKEMEEEFGLDGRLDRIKAHVLATFPLPAKSPSATQAASGDPKLRGPASIETEQDDDVDRIKLVK